MEDLHIVIITKNFSLKEKIKTITKKWLKKDKKFGPEEVTDVLLQYTNYSHFSRISINKNIKEADIVLCEGINEELLAKVVRFKKKYQFKIVVHHGFSHPNELKNSSILNFVDTIIVPSKWVKDLFLSQNPTLKIKLLPWSCEKTQINLNKDIKTDKPLFIIYDKTEVFHQSKVKSIALPTVRDEIIMYLIANEIDFKIIKYLNYTRKEYEDLLTLSDALIYLSGQETQGLALMKAWMFNVPTLIYDRKWAAWDKIECIGTTCPCFDESVGEYFESIDEFPNKLEVFLSNLGNYAPSQYYHQNFDYPQLFQGLDTILLNTFQEK